MIVVASISPTSGLVALSVIVVFMAALCYSYLNPRLRQRVRWLGQWEHITVVGFAGMLCALAVLAVVVAGNAWKIEIIQKRNLFLLGATFVVGFAGWLYDRCLQK